MSSKTYAELCEAIANHVADEQDNSSFVAHWVLVSGLDSLNGFDEQSTTVRVDASPRTPGYTISGLATQAANLYSITEYE